MPLFQGSQQQYYGQQQFTTSTAQATGGGNAGEYILTFPDNETLLNNLATMPTLAGQMTVDTIVGGVTIIGVAFTFNATTNTVTLGTTVAAGSTVTINIINPQLGNYQFISIQTLINNFIISYDLS